MSWAQLNLSELKKLRAEKAQRLACLETERAAADRHCADALARLQKERLGLQEQAERLTRVSDGAAAVPAGASNGGGGGGGARDRIDYEGVDSDDEFDPSAAAAAAAGPAEGDGSSGAVGGDGARSISWPHTGWLFVGGKRTTDLPVAPFQAAGRGRVLLATRDVARGDVIFHDASCFDVPTELSACLVSSSFSKGVARFAAAARAGKAFAPHNIKAKELEAGAVLMTRTLKTGKDAEQGFDLGAIKVTGVSFKDGVLPVLVQFLETAQRGDGAACWKVFDLCCPVKEADEATAEKYLKLSTSFLQSIQDLPLYQQKLTIDKAMRLLLTVQCNAIAVRRPGYAGLAVFPFASLMEHACDPNAAAVVLHKTGDDSESLLRVVATRDVKKGDAISINYGVSYEPWEQRRASLRRSHFFECGCAACTDGGAPDRARSFVPDGAEADPRYTPPASLEDADAALYATIVRVANGSEEPPRVTMPVGSGAARWTGTKDLDVTGSPSDAVEATRMTQAEAAAEQRWESVAQDLRGGDWGGVEAWLGGGAAPLHPSHQVLMAVASQCLPLAFRQGEKGRVLWLLRCMVLNAVWVDGANSVAPVAQTVAEYCDVAAQVFVKMERKSTALKYVGLGLKVLEEAGHTETVRHRQLTNTQAALSSVREEPEMA